MASASSASANLCSSAAGRRASLAPTPRTPSRAAAAAPRVWPSPSANRVAPFERRGGLARCCSVSRSCPSGPRTDRPRPPGPRRGAAALPMCVLGFCNLCSRRHGWQASRLQRLDAFALLQLLGECALRAHSRRACSSAAALVQQLFERGVSRCRLVALRLGSARRVLRDAAHRMLRSGRPARARRVSRCSSMARVVALWWPGPRIPNTAGQPDEIRGRA